MCIPGIDHGFRFYEQTLDRVWHASLISKHPSLGIPDGAAYAIVVFLDGYSSDDRFKKCRRLPIGSVLSATLSLLHINVLLVPSTFRYADDSTVAAATW